MKEAIFLMLLTLLLGGCYSEKEVQVQLSFMQLEKIDTVSKYNHGPFVVYTWRDLKQDVLLKSWSFTDTLFAYKVGAVVPVFFQR